jgi:GAF domain-containing protein
LGSPLYGHTGSVIFIPLWTDQKQIGTLELDTFNTQASFRQDELSTLLPLADQVAHICERYLNMDQLTDQKTASSSV